MCWRSKNTRKSGNSPPPTESTSAHNFKTITPNSDVSLLLTAMMVALVTILPRLLRFLHLHRTLPLTLAHSCTTWCDRGAESKWKKKLPASHFLSLACGAKIAPVLRLWSPRKKTPFEPKKKSLHRPPPFGTWHSYFNAKFLLKSVKFHHSPETRNVATIQNMSKQEVGTDFGSLLAHFWLTLHATDESKPRSDKRMYWLNTDWLLLCCLLVGWKSNHHHHRWTDGKKNKHHY